MSATTTTGSEWRMQAADSSHGTGMGPQKVQDPSVPLSPEPAQPGSDYADGGNSPPNVSDEQLLEQLCGESC